MYVDPPSDVNKTQTQLFELLVQMADVRSAAVVGPRWNARDVAFRRGMRLFLDAFLYCVSHFPAALTPGWMERADAALDGWPEFGRFLRALCAPREDGRGSICTLAASLGLVEVLWYVVDTEADGGKYSIDEATLLAAAASEYPRGAACFRLAAATTADVWSKKACLAAATKNPSASGKECVAFLRPSLHCRSARVTEGWS